MGVSRRTFLSSVVAAGAAGPTLFVPGAAAGSPPSGFDEAVAAAGRIQARFATAPADPAVAAADLELWRDVQAAWAVDRSILNLENGGLQPAAAYTNHAFGEAWRYANEAPSYTNARILWPKVEEVRARLARAFGCDTEEMAITRNTTEGFLAVGLGFPMERGDEVLTTTQDYHRFRNAFLQRQEREGIVLRSIQLTIPAEDAGEVVRRFEEAITPRTRVILLSHLFQLTGQVMPIRAVVQMARTRNILVIVDGAHGFSHVPATRDDLDCDVYATSLHKWLGAPHGTGFLYVRRALIPKIWPLMPSVPPPAGFTRDDIRKFEARGTASAAPFLAIGAALDVVERIGLERKMARLVWLRERWLSRIADLPGVRLNTSRRPGLAGAIMNIDFEGLHPVALARWLWDNHRALVAGIENAEFRGIRVVPAIYTTEGELDRFADLLLHARKHGVG